MSEPSPFVTVLGESYFRIENVDRLQPFLMSIASDADCWMFVASTGGLTAGRVDADGALFPYETVDRLYHGHHHTGPVSVLRIHDVTWRPFLSDGPGDGCRRNLYKNRLGNQILFEEIHPYLKLAFRYRWTAAAEWGWVRTVWIENLGQEVRKVEVVDGLRNVLPFGAPLALYQQRSTLVDAYKHTDLDGETGLAVYSLTSKIIDRAEAAEELRANAVWTVGEGSPSLFLGDALLAGNPFATEIRDEVPRKGRRGHYLTRRTLEIPPRGTGSWHIVGDVGLGHVELADLGRRLRDPGALENALHADLDRAHANLTRNLASADGLQHTGDPVASAHHLANVLFNNMRGGVAAHNGLAPREDFARFLETRNRTVAARHAATAAGLPELVRLGDLREAAPEDADWLRLADEYVPIMFGRRHGDPSRPWNRFSIRLVHPDGSPALQYEGNWRDIFQNWEALAVSFPDLLPQFVAKFVNASTVDGFNPYRITREGVDWEVEDPEDPWSYIGYWGDHQVIYLLKFLEALERVRPGLLRERLGEVAYSYAEVPYRLKPYEAIVQDPQNTLRFDDALESSIEKRVASLGGDGKLVRDGKEGVLHVSLMEKLLVPTLAKLSNWIPDGGIWMNTQRPEWNDANNALVGNGISVVTACYLRRHIVFLSELCQSPGTVPISREVVVWARGVAKVLRSHEASVTAKGLPDPERRDVVDGLGAVFSRYRDSVYETGPSAPEDLSLSEIRDLLELARQALDRTIRSNRREDGLYHAYNLQHRSPAGLAVERLQLMLEGQVAALSSGLLSPAEAVSVIDAMFDSDLYREDQESFMLYPERELPGFMERNRVPDALVDEISLLQKLLEAGEGSVVARDALGQVRFNPRLENAGSLGRALDRLGARPEWTEGVQRDRGAVMEAFEAVFGHHAYTGRSGVMYAFEGIGSIYWHMVAKLLLALQEIALRALEDGSPEAAALVERYDRVRSGLGFEKSPEEYGAFPTDPYSHTPKHAGAQQPGMTGQVKEEILTRFGELGTRVRGGVLALEPSLLHRKEFLREAAVFRYYDVNGEEHALQLEPGSLAFTYCQTPIVYRLGTAPEVRVRWKDGRETVGLDKSTTASIHERRGAVERVEATVVEADLADDSA